MSQKEIEAAVNALCLSSQYGTLYRVLKGIPGSLRIISSDQAAEMKRQELLGLLKRNIDKQREP